MAEQPEQRFASESEHRALEVRFDRFRDEVAAAFRQLRRKDQQHDELIQSNQRVVDQLTRISARLDRPRPPEWSAQDWIRWASIIAAITGGLFAHAEMTRAHSSPTLPVVEDPYEALPQDPVQPGDGAN